MTSAPPSWVTQLNRALADLGPSVAQLGQRLQRLLLPGLETPSGRALRQGGEAVGQLAAADFPLSYRDSSIAVVVVEHGYGPVPTAALDAAKAAAAATLAQWDLTRDSPRWN
jgi:hypothetical protein